MPVPSSSTVTTPSCRRDRDGAGRRAPLGGVVEQVGQGALERGGVALDVPRVRGDLGTTAPGARRRTRATAWSRTSCSSTVPITAGVGSSRASSTRSPTRVVSSSSCARTSVSSSVRASSGSAAAGLGEQVDVGAQRGERRAQLVAGVGDQPALPVPRRGERGEHLVERRRQPGDLVVALDRDRGQPLGARDVLGGRGEPADRPQPVAGHRPAGHPGGDRSRRCRTAGVTRPELGEHLLLRLQRLGDDQRQPGLPLDGHGDHPVVDAAGPHGAQALLRVAAWRPRARASSSRITSPVSRKLDCAVVLA